MKTLLSLPESQWVGGYASTRKRRGIQVVVQAVGGCAVWSVAVYDGVVSVLRSTRFESKWRYCSE